MSEYCFGVDIGGTTVKIGLFTTDGELIDKWQIKTRKEDNGSFVLPDIVESINAKIEDENIAKADVIGIGLCAPGPVDDKGNIKRAVNIGWGEFNVIDKMHEYTALPVAVGNDANVAALGEMWKGAGSPNMVMVTLGTGIGGGVIINGKIVNGATGSGGEIGHIHIDDDEKEICGCGNKGCLEQYGSATGIARLARRRLEIDDVPSVLRNIEPKKLDAKAVWDAVKESDVLAMEVADDFGKRLAKGLAIIASVVNPEVFVVGGGVSAAGDIVLDYIKKYFKKYVFHGCQDAKFVLASLGNDAGIYGSAKLVIDGVSKS